ncbi:hypothetical protein [Vibrio phage Va_90-11-287_p41]|nr:hypothetical protein [Vibrio anguillarum]QCW19469.1 hypothetical protein [Vibrio phage Va_90-11-287_p41]QCW19559.1 hypothetical protein [Vibrio phage Va_90-11-287_p41_Ba35]QCW19649.1 hypothetical protein [Vibrio phage Va_90-11-287_p41_T265]QCW19752.1 hypothetical protein [Vibrio phage Va_91-7-154_p41]QCW19831.1 hypothetical protein [Vibrio phage Va_178/90_p41]
MKMIVKLLKSALSTIGQAMLYGFCIVALSAMVGSGLICGMSRTATFNDLIGGKALVITIVDLEKKVAESE